LRSCANPDAKSVAGCEKFSPPFCHGAGSVGAPIAAQAARPCRRTLFECALSESASFKCFSFNASAAAWMHARVRSGMAGRCRVLGEAAREARRAPAM